MVYENSFGNYLNIDGAVEHFFDSSPSEWGSLTDTEGEKTQYVEDYYESIAIMENGLKVKVEIYLANDIEDDDDPWVCKAYKLC
ncbi:hypothetical protein C6352_26425 [Bacillus thuringiensis]|nr:hypothetical protein C6352_26425 [Bacillus thuringiensis]